MKKVIHSANLFFRVSVTCLLYIFSFNNVIAQADHKVDSLQKDLNTAQTETKKVDLLNQLAKELSRKDSAQARKYIHTAISKANNIEYYKGLSKSYLQSGYIFYFGKNYNEGKKEFEKSLSFALQAQDKKSISHAYRGIGLMHYWKNLLEESLEYYFKALKIAEEVDDRRIIMKLNHDIGDSYRYLRKPKIAEKYLLKAQEINNKEFNEIRERANLIYSLGVVNKHQLKYRIAEKYYFDALQIYLKLDDQINLFYCYKNLSNLNRKIGDYKKSIEYIIKILEEVEYRESKSSESDLINNIGVLFYEIKDYENALRYYRRSINMYQKLGLESSYSLTFNNIGLIHQRLHDYDSAEYYFTKCIDFGEQYKLERALGWGYYGLFQTLEAKNREEEALFALEKSISIREKEGRDELLAQSYNSMGEVLRREKKYIKALSYYQRAAIICKEINNPLNYKDAAEGISLCFEKLNKPYQALAYQRIFKQLSDSLLNDENTKKLTKQTMQYEFDKEKGEIKARNEKELLIKQNELERQKYFTYTFISGFLIVVAFAIVVFRNFKQKKKVNKLLEEKNKEITEQKEEITNQAEELKTSNEKLSELSQFKENLTSMIVHDLKNPINAIIGLSRNYDSEENKLKTINNSGKKMLNLVLNILDVQKFEETKFNLLNSKINLSELLAKAIEETTFLCQEKNIKIAYGLKEDFSLTIDFDIVLRVLVNIISNAIKYSDFNRIVQIKIEKENEGFIRCIIRDEGRGIPKEQIANVFDKFWQFKSRKSSGVRSVGLGLTFCKMAIEAHKGKIMAVSEEGVWTEISFTLPYASTVQNSIEKEIKAITNINIENLSLSSKDKDFLKEYTDKMRAFNSYETTDILNVLYGINSEDLKIEKWKEEIENSVISGNINRFEELLDMVN